MHRRQRAHLVPDLLGARAAEVGAEPLRELVDDLDVVARLAGRVERLAHALDAPLARGDGAFRLRTSRRSREHDVGQLRGLREEDVLHDEVVEPAQSSLRARVWSASDCAGFSPMT